MQVVDHINGDVLDNRRSNLRICTQAQNLMNKRRLRSDNTTGYKGVRHQEGRWYAIIQAAGISHTSKGFATKLEAAKEYNKMALKYHGEFAALNPIESDVDAQLFESVEDVRDAG